MTKYANKFLSVILSVCLFGVLAVAFCGCGQSGNTIYSNVINQYNQMISKNTDVFDANGYISITYSDNLSTAISSSDKYAKLSHNTISGETTSSLFEPVLLASMQSTSYYIKRLDLSLVDISAQRAQSVLDALQNFEATLNQFVEEKHKLEARTSLDLSSTIIQNEFDAFSASYRELNAKACALSAKVLEVYANDVFVDKKFEGERYASGKMRLEFLSKLNQFATIDQQILVDYYFDKTYTSQPISKTQKLLSSFNNIADLTNWEGTTETITDEEKACINTFSNLLAYNEVFNIQQSQFNQALSQVLLTKYYNYLSASYDETDFSADERMYFSKINEFLQTYTLNMLNYLQELSSNISTFKSMV